MYQACNRTTTYIAVLYSINYTPTIRGFQVVPERRSFGCSDFAQKRASSPIKHISSPANRVPSALQAVAEYPAGAMYASLGSESRVQTKPLNWSCCSYPPPPRPRLFHLCVTIEPPGRFSLLLYHIHSYNSADIAGEQNKQVT